MWVWSDRGECVEVHCEPYLPARSFICVRDVPAQYYG